MHQDKYIACSVAFHAVAALEPVTICQAFSLEWQRVRFVGNNAKRTITGRVRLLCLLFSIGGHLAELQHARIEILVLKLVSVASEAKRRISEIF
tara:strand:- start:8 stop:289 length:282 start_codon:yes stop_codon:yes gene_type:complete